MNGLTVIKTPSSRCPACHAPATCNFAYACSPPIYVWSCGCKVQYQEDKSLIQNPPVDATVTKA